VVTQPNLPSQTCTVTNGSGTMGVTPVASVSINCVTNTFTVGGNVTGLAQGESVVLRNNNADDLTIGANGSFAFATPTPSGGNFQVSVFTNPSSPIAQTCVVSNGSGKIGSGNMTGVSVNCATNSYTISGTLAFPGGTIVLQNNSGAGISLSANGSFSFPVPVTSGQTYSVALTSSPADQVCTVLNASGTITNANIVNVTVVCSTLNWLQSQPWTFTGNATGSFKPVDNSEAFTYTARANATSDTYRAVATSTTTLNYTWNYTGLHSTVGAHATLIAFAEGPGGTTLVTLQPDTSVIDGFTFSGASSLTITAGYGFGFMVTGTNTDPQMILDGSLKVTQF